MSSAGAATLAVVAGIEDAGLTVGRDVDIVSKQAVLHANKDTSIPSGTSSGVKPRSSSHC